ncbi:MAG: tRNA (N(6)-L-threonylcarbamoyladenosine(37)-C(2))-methylthiotransferase MtaB [Leptospiraceae bacterium]|nr:tRNA (N(6)-L-threonylcarbamoyladenosine(37)-C(2))-methylthiotransferase MtaB [Leptospiraceae bacterium]
MSTTLETQKKVSFHTLGCRLNLFETDGLVSSFQKLGAKTVSDSESPDIVVINTCTVTNKADSKNRNLIRNAIKSNPLADVWVTGCYAETDKDVILKIPGVRGVLGNSEKSKLAYFALGKETNVIMDRFSYSDVLPSNHTRGYLKIQDGCNRVCSYCKIPAARGKGVSRKEEDILAQVQFLQDSGIGEIVLTGVNLGWYRDDENKKAFNQILKKILDKLEYSRLRISSIEPSDVNEELAEISLHPRFCNFLHVPLQSGNSKILRSMKRSYTAETFRKRIELAKKINPNLFLGTDIITGFPNESEEEFQDSIQVVLDLEISKIHAFPYSPRAGTLANTFTDSIPKEIKKERVKILNQISDSQYERYAKSRLNKRFEAILEENNNFITDNFIKGKLNLSEESKRLSVGQFLDIRISKVNEKEIIGSLD